MMNKFGERLRELRESNNMKPSELANLLCITESTLNKYERGVIKSFPLDRFLQIANIFNVSLEYLIGASDRTQLLEESEIEAYVKIPIYGSVPAGVPLEAIQVDDGYLEIKASMLKGDKTLIALRVKGDSMYPFYLEGDLIIIELTSDFKSGEDVVVFVGYDHEATLKRIHQKDDHIELEPLNREYPVRKYYPTDEPVRVLGKVVELRREI